MLDTDHDTLAEGITATLGEVGRCPAGRPGVSAIADAPRDRDPSDDELMRTVEAFLSDVRQHRSADRAEALMAAIDRELGRLDLDLLEDRRGDRRVLESMATLGRLRARVGTHVLDRRLAVAARIHEAMERLRSVGTTAELIRDVPSELCRTCDVDLAIVSHLSGPTFRPVGIHRVGPGARPTPSTRDDALLRADVRLDSRMIESEVARRGAAILVVPGHGERAARAIQEVMAGGAYAVVPVVANGRVVGLLHAGTPDGRDITTNDLDGLSVFAEGVGLAVERTVLRTRLVAQRRHATTALAAAVSIVDGADDPGPVLAPRPVPLAPTRTPIAASRVVSDLPRRGALRDLFSRRELDVLEAMARGASNAQIADELMVEVSTIKSHVRNIFRKLTAKSRAEAVVHYVRLAGEERAA